MIDGTHACISSRARRFPLRPRIPPGRSEVQGAETAKTKDFEKPAAYKALLDTDGENSSGRSFILDLTSLDDSQT